MFIVLNLFIFFINIVVLIIFEKLVLFLVNIVLRFFKDWVVWVCIFFLIIFIVFGIRGICLDINNKFLVFIVWEYGFKVVGVLLVCIILCFILKFF